MSAGRMGSMRRCGPFEGSRVTVRCSDPPGAYPLPPGLKVGETVVLEEFDRGWWEVKRESDGAQFQIYLLNVDQLLTVPAPVEVPRAEMKPDWRGIIAVARETQDRLGGLSSGKPGQRRRQIFLETYRQARALGYHGDEDDWEIFVRRRGV